MQQDEPVRIPVGDKFALVDADIAETISRHRWGLNIGGYAVRSQREGKKMTQVFMHRVINETPKGKQTDHINGDRLDNRRANLRTATAKQNAANRAGRGKQSKYRGVCEGRRYERVHYRARIFVNGKQILLGTFKTEREAAMAYNNAAQDLHGEFALLNDL